MPARMTASHILLVGNHRVQDLGPVTTQCIAHVAMVLTNMCQLAQQVNKTQ